jgi:alkaline phosphatase
MTEKAIELLSQDKDGFFLMVEGSQIDWAGHNTDPIYMVTDFIEFDEAVKVAIDFAEEDGKTLVLVFPDHDTGGMTLGNYYQNDNNLGQPYTATTIEGLLDVFNDMQMTSVGVERMMPDYTLPSIKSAVDTYWGITLSDTEAQAILDLWAEPEVPYFNYALARYISEHYTAIGWTTHGHNGMDVPLWTYGPDRPVGFFDNTELAELTADALGINLDKTQEKLFVNVDDEYLEWQLDETDPANPVLVIQGNKYEYQLPISKNIISYNGMTKELNGIVVYSPEIDQVFIPMQAVKMIK